MAYPYRKWITQGSVWSTFAHSMVVSTIKLQPQKTYSYPFYLSVLSRMLEYSKWSKRRVQILPERNSVFRDICYASFSNKLRARKCLNWTTDREVKFRRMKSFYSQQTPNVVRNPEVLPFKRKLLSSTCLCCCLLHFIFGLWTVPVITRVFLSCDLIRLSLSCQNEIHSCFELVWMLD